jgi:hypothetical protein
MEQGEDGHRVRHAGALHEDVIERAAGGHLHQLRRQVVLQRGADRATLEGQHLECTLAPTFPRVCVGKCVRDQAAVYVQGCDVIHNRCNPAAATSLVLHKVFQQRRFACPEKSA